MSVKIQVVLNQDKRDQLRRQAVLGGLSLSTWLEHAGLQCLKWAQTPAKLDSAEALAVFFEQCDAREQGREPDWEEHLAVCRFGQPLMRYNGSRASCRPSRAWR